MQGGAHPWQAVKEEAVFDFGLLRPREEGYSLRKGQSRRLCLLHRLGSEPCPLIARLQPPVCKKHSACGFVNYPFQEKILEGGELSWVESLEFAQKQKIKKDDDMEIKFIPFDQGGQVIHTVGHDGKSDGSISSVQNEDPTILKEQSIIKATVYFIASQDLMVRGNWGEICSKSFFIVVKKQLLM